MKSSNTYLLIAFMFLLASYFLIDGDIIIYAGVIFVAFLCIIGSAIFSHMEMKGEMLEFRIKQKQFSLIIDLLMTIAFDEKRTGKFLHIDKKELKKKGGKKNDKSNN